MTKNISQSDISFPEAFKRTMENISALPSELTEISLLNNRVAAEDVVSIVDAPSTDVSLRDGYAARARDVGQATPDHPAMLELKGALFAGASHAPEVGPGQAVRIMTGATLPRGAECVVSQEFGSDDGAQVRLVRNALIGQNILAKGSDLTRGQTIVARGTRLRPGQIGFIAAAGHASVNVYKTPRVAIIATGDEVLAPGRPFEAGKVFASNLVTTAAWCSQYGMETQTAVVSDREEAIADAVLHALESADSIVTSGGAWKSERDLTISILDSLGWKKYYHRVRMGPGKAVAFGLLRSKPVFCLPGGPPSNQMAFLQIALPGLRVLAGERNTGLPRMHAVMGETVRGQYDWTQFIHGTLEKTDDAVIFHPLRLQSRLRMLAEARAVVSIPEGEERIDKGAVVMVQLLWSAQNS